MKTKKAFIIIMSIMFLSTTINAINTNVFEKNLSNSTTSKWTIMYYMCCDSNMHDYGEPLLENLSKIKSNKDLNIVAMYDGKFDGDAKIIYINKNGSRINLNEELGWPNEVNYANSFTFENFVSDMMRYFPADNYALIIYGSGGPGWQIFSLHDSHGTYEKLIKKNSFGLTTPQIGSVFKNITKDGAEKIDVIYTSCAMNTIELAYEISAYVDYMIGTQDCLSSDFIYRYYQSTWEVYNNTDMTPDEFSKYSSDILKPVSFYYADEWLGGLGFINKFFNKLDFKKFQTVMHHDNIGVINNSNIDELIKSVDAFCRFLIVNIQDYDIYKDIKCARQNSRESSKCHAKPGSKIISFLNRHFSMNFTAYNAVVDLYDFCEKLREKTDNDFLKIYCVDVMEKLNKTVTYINKVEKDPIHGLNIYFPVEKKIYNAYVLPGEIPAKYEELMFSKDTAWDDFLKEYLELKNDGV